MKVGSLYHQTYRGLAVRRLYMSLCRRDLSEFDEKLHSRKPSGMATGLNGWPGRICHSIWAGVDVICPYGRNHGHRRDLDAAQ